MGYWKEIDKYARMYIEDEDEHKERISKKEEKDTLTDSEIIDYFVDFILQTQDKLKLLGFEIDKNTIDILTKRKRNIKKTK